MPSKTWNTVLIVLGAILSSSACNSGRVYLTHSQWADYQIVINGEADKWQGKQAFLEKEKLLVSFLNDREYLYIGLVASENPTGARIMRQGLTVWFDPKGGKEKTFGIRYPLVARFPGPPRDFGEMEPGDRGDTGDRGDRGERGDWGDRGDREQGQPRDMGMRPPREPGQELEIMRSEKGEPERIEIEQAKAEGLEIKVATSGELFVYELKIPLAATQTHPLAIGAQPGAEINVGIESSGKAQGRPPGGPPPGGMGGGMGGRPGMGGMGGRPGGGGRGMQDFDTEPDTGQPLKCWLLVRLANK